MNAISIIAKKRDKKELKPEEIDYFIKETLAIIDAAAMEYSFASPFIIDLYGMFCVSMFVRASTNIKSGFVSKFSIALFNANFVAFSMFISSISFWFAIPNMDLVVTKDMEQQNI